MSGNPNTGKIECIWHLLMSGYQIVIKLDHLIFKEKISLNIKWSSLVTILDIECPILLMSGYRMVVWLSRKSLA